MTNDLGNWYIVQQPSGQCEILPETALLEPQSQSSDLLDVTAQSERAQWGPFKSKNQAIAKRVGLIRAGKCQPQ